MYVYLEGLGVEKQGTGGHGSRENLGWSLGFVVSKIIKVELQRAPAWSWWPALGFAARICSPDSQPGLFAARIRSPDSQPGFAARIRSQDLQRRSASWPSSHVPCHLMGHVSARFG